MVITEIWVNCENVFGDVQEVLHLILGKVSKINLIMA